MFTAKRKRKFKKKINFRLVNNAKDYKKYESRPSFVSQKIFDKNLVVTHEIKPVLTLDIPIYVGFSIFDLSKLLMYENITISISCYLQTQTV